MLQVSNVTAHWVLLESFPVSFMSEGCHRELGRAVDISTRSEISQPEVRNLNWAKISGQSENREISTGMHKS